MPKLRGESLKRKRTVTWSQRISTDYLTNFKGENGNLAVKKSGGHHFNTGSKLMPSVTGQADNMYLLLGCTVAHTRPPPSVVFCLKHN